MKYETVCVIGLGYIGLPTAAMFASNGANVIGVDVSHKVVETINNGQIHIIEPGLSEIVAQVTNENNLTATQKPKPADAFVIAVPTPFKQIGNDIPEPDLTFIFDACSAIAPVLEIGNLVVLESTSPVGTTDRMCAWLSELRPDLSFPDMNCTESDISVAYCPERVLPGKIIHELIHNDRILGGISKSCADSAIKLYSRFVTGKCYGTNARTAEMVKLTENASRDCQIAFANEISMICDENDVDVHELINLANAHPRVDILRPGPGVGGHCIAVDPWFLVFTNTLKTRLIRTAREVNAMKEEWTWTKILQNFRQRNLNGIVICGITYKPDIDDLRESPSLRIALRLHEMKLCPMKVVEPNLSEFRDLALVTLDEALNKNSEYLWVQLVNHIEFKDLALCVTNFVDFS